MATADIAIGAAGGAAWERACVGLPTVLVVLADNQREGAGALAACGAAALAGAPDAADFDARLGAALESTALAEPRARMASSAARLVDGSGTARVVAVLEAPLALRPARPEDDVLVWRWRAASPPHAMAGGPNPPLEEHRAWFARALANPSQRLWIATDAASRPLAHLRLDRIAARSARVSVVVAPESRGRGYGVRLLTLLADHARAEGFDRLVADIHEDNTASRAIFRAAGYRELAGPSPAPGFSRFAADAEADGNDGAELG
jgi:RimJ/RimL family protein N-acetyltransferase